MSIRIGGPIIQHPIPVYTPKLVYHCGFLSSLPTSFSVIISEGTGYEGCGKCTDRLTHVCVCRCVYTDVHTDMSVYVYNNRQSTFPGPISTQSEVVPTTDKGLSEGPIVSDEIV